jgi:hypothetical protein
LALAGVTDGVYAVVHAPVVSDTEAQGCVIWHPVVGYKLNTQFVALDEAANVGDEVLRLHAAHLVCFSFPDCYGR